MEQSTAVKWLVATDIEGSSERWDRGAEAMRDALKHHDELLQHAIQGHGGDIFKHTGDGVFAVFADATSAARAAVDAQLAIGRAGFEAVGGLKVRVGVHGGVVHPRDGDYFGPVVNRVARVMDAGNGGQVVVTHDVVEEVGDADGDITFVDQGLHRLKGLTRPLPLAIAAHPELACTPAALRSLNSGLTNIAQPARALIGRHETLADIARLLESPGPISVIGPGGVGKTALARHAAHALSRRFPDGTWFCDLAPIRDPTHVIELVAGVLGVERRGADELIDTLCEALAVRTTLIVLDNCEHVIGAVAELVRRTTMSSSTVRFLATSRQPIEVVGERRLRLTPLRLPPTIATAELPFGDAAELFSNEPQSSDGPWRWTTATARL